ncbi:putative host specificity domain protein [Escherichia coli p0305293.2]|nr:putative host specificity domain protein [Escherichia coli p0305293.2]
MLAVNSQTRTLTLDREITLPSSGTTLISLVDGGIRSAWRSVRHRRREGKVSRVPDGVAIQRWGLKLPTCASACSAA